MDNFDQIPKRRPKSPGWGRLLPFLVIGYILFTSFVGSIRLPSTNLEDPIQSVFFNTSILLGGVVVAVILVISYMTYSKK
ncbi:MAG: hypothetical protein HPY60_01845 [Candidatus Methanofastidiosum sp.]|nr:hypothetical protein [Methanofastidiosum sp.]NYT14316.1 hypothetical protein [Candidatus Methanofastidiosa archaeon]